MDKKKENLIKWGAGLFFIISLCVLIGWGIADPEVNLKVPLIIYAIIVIISIVAFFNRGAFKRAEKDEEIPKPLSIEEIEEKIRAEFEKKYWSHITINGGLGCIKTRPINKNLIYAYEIESIYPIKIRKFSNDRYMGAIAIINANYSDVMPISFHNPDISDQILEKEMNRKSFNPRKPVAEEGRTETDLSTGKKVKYVKRSYKKKIKEEKPDIE